MEGWTHFSTTRFVPGAALRLPLGASVGDADRRQERHAGEELHSFYTRGQAGITIMYYYYPVSVESVVEEQTPPGRSLVVFELSA